MRMEHGRYDCSITFVSGGLVMVDRHTRFVGLCALVFLAVSGPVIAQPTLPPPPAPEPGPVVPPISAQPAPPQVLPPAPAVSGTAPVAPAQSVPLNPPPAIAATSPVPFTPSSPALQFNIDPKTPILQLLPTAPKSTKPARR